MIAQAFVYLYSIYHLITGSLSLKFLMYPICTVAVLLFFLSILFAFYMAFTDATPYGLPIALALDMGVTGPFGFTSMGILYLLNHEEPTTLYQINGQAYKLIRV